MSMAMSSAVAAPLSTRCTSGRRKALPVRACTSRAMPKRLRQSERLGVTSKSIITSSSPVALAKAVPVVRSSLRTIIPSWLSLSPSSSSAQIIPRDSTPRILAFLICMPLGSVQPGSATATVCPAATLGAPQTMVLTSVPTSTSQTVRRSAFSWGWQELTRPITIPSKRLPRAFTPSNSKPAMVNRSTNSGHSQSKST